MKRFLVLVLFGLLSMPLSAQFLDNGSGLMQMPSADMNPSGTFMITNCFLNKHTLADRWGYHTFGYGLNITFWSRVEIGYSMVIFDGERHPNPTARDRMMFNQDRHFSAKLLLLKEGEFGINWIPAIAVGICDPATGSGGGEYIGSDVSGGTGNGYFNRNYIIATKHFQTKIGDIGAHLGYQFNTRKDECRINAPCAGLEWRPIWLQSELFSLDAIAEFDSRTFNLGCIASIWKGHFDLMMELQSMKWFSAALRFKCVLR